MSKVRDGARLEGGCVRNAIRPTASRRATSRPRFIWTSVNYSRSCSWRSRRDKLRKRSAVQPSIARTVALRGLIATRAISPKHNPQSSSASTMHSSSNVRSTATRPVRNTKTQSPISPRTKKSSPAATVTSSHRFSQEFDRLPRQRPENREVAEDVDVARGMLSHVAPEETPFEHRLMVPANK